MPYGAADCVRDHTQWNNMVAYIKHAGSCNAGAGHVLYNNDASAVEWFKFYEHSVDFLGDRAIYINNDETYIGHGAGDSITTGIENTAIGTNTLHSNTEGYGNVASGARALYANTTGHNNVANGIGALLGNTLGHNNVAVGRYALYGNIATHNNVAVGYGAGEGCAQAACIYIGKDAGKNVNVNDNRLYISNSGSAFPLIYGEFDNDIVAFGNLSDAFFFKFSHDANDAIVETEAANRSIYLKPHGTGLVKWGTETTNAGSDRGKLIAMETAAGTTVYLKTYDTV